MRDSLGNVIRDLSYDAAVRITAYTHYSPTGAPQTSGYSATINLEGHIATHVRAGVTSAYAYNGQGQRVRKFASTGAASTVIYVYGHARQLDGGVQQHRGGDPRVRVDAGRAGGGFHAERDEPAEQGTQSTYDSADPRTRPNHPCSWPAAASSPRHDRLPERRAGRNRKPGPHRAT